MAIPKFFHRSTGFVENETVVLSHEETRHASQSRRLQVNNAAMLLNGQGVTAIGRFVELSKKKAVVLVEHVEQHKPPKRHTIIASAIPKGDRQKVMIDMLTQCGVTGFIPLECEFSVAKTNDKTLEKWRRIVVEACKQSANPFMMDIHSPLSIEHLIASEVWQQSQVFMADQCAPNQPVIDIDTLGSLALIGPEGGFSDAEMNSLNARGVEKIKFSTHILRTETAAVSAAITLINR